MSGGARSGRLRRVLGGIILALVLLLIAAAVYALTLGPIHSSNAQVETASGDRAIAIASADTDLALVELTPAAPWRVQPLVTDLEIPIMNELPNPLLPNDPRIAFGRHEGLLLTAPDGVLEVRVRVLAGDTSAAAELAEQRLRDALPGVLAEERPPVAVEELASGATIHHFTLGESLTGIVSIDGALVEVRADLPDDARPLDDYRPALSDLVESMKGSS